MTDEEVRRALADDEDGRLDARARDALEAALEDPARRLLLVEHYMVSAALREHLAALRENRRRLGRRFEPARARARVALAIGLPVAAAAAGAALLALAPGRPGVPGPAPPDPTATTRSARAPALAPGGVAAAPGDTPVRPRRPGSTFEELAGAGAPATDPTGGAPGEGPAGAAADGDVPPARAAFTGSSRPVALLRRAPRALVYALRGSRADAAGMVGENRREWRCPDAQREGVRNVLTGVVLGRPELVDEGLRVAEATFARQRPEGGFDDGDTVCLAKFIGETSHALLALREAGAEGEHASRLAALLPSIERAIAHLSEPGQIAELRGRGRGFQSHLFASAETFGHTGLLLGQPDLVRRGRELLDAVIAGQRPDGAFPMRDGTDSVYQGVMLFFLGRYLSRFPSPEHEAAHARGIRWLRGRFAADGSLDVTGNTEVCGEGTPRCQPVDWSCIGWALVYHGALHGDATAFAEAQRVLARRRVLRAGEVPARGP